MPTPSLTRLLIGMLLVVAMPSIACVGWYSLQSVTNANLAVRAMVLVAYPTALITLALLVLALSSAKQSGWRIGNYGVFCALAVSAAVLARSGLLIT